GDVCTGVFMDMFLAIAIIFGGLIFLYVIFAEEVRSERRMDSHVDATVARLFQDEEAAFNGTNGNEHRPFFVEFVEENQKRHILPVKKTVYNKLNIGDYGRLRYNGFRFIDFSKEGEVIENLPVSRFGTHKAWVNIMYGCDKFCTYCIVPYTRGKERSRLVEDILSEIEELKGKGFKEITLLGQNVNAYGKDLKEPANFAMLLKSVAETKIERIRFTTSHPWDFSDEMIEIIASYDNIMPYIHLPVQSGNSDMLKIMGRRYSIDEYKTLFGKLKERIADCAFSTDIIVGFPNETDEQFKQTLEIVEHCQFDNAFTFIYSPREGTPAAQMADNVPKDVKKKRLAQLNAKVAQYALKNNQAYIGRTVEVLVDGPSKKNPEIYSGYTRTQKLVNFKADGVISGDLVNVTITDCKTWFLIGEKA
ncbi:MAG: tRNA (N6-isopentenyl adenosine(37)-C2)-methylthiotransferase MiaB, partial [Firmicutes bacterium HGW-Firmicutes-19]